jgi:S-DNA-T family DNA segregation ATPase FtsK/SpoIIIE
MHHDVSDAHLAERAVRSLRAELLGRDERAWRGVALPRLVIVVDEPAAVAMEHPQLVSSLLEIASDGQRLGIHLIVATEHPSLVLDFANAPAIGLRVALRLSDEHESVTLIGTGGATSVPRRTPGRGLIRVGDSEPVEFQAAMVSASSSASGGHDLELRPYVVGRELTPMELRIMRETNGNVGGGNVGGAGSRGGVRNDLSRLVVEITAAAVAVEHARTRRLSPEPLPHVVDPRRLTTEHPGGGVPFALVDLPDQQRQQIRWWEPGVDGSLLIYGADGAGTSAVLASLAVGAAERYPADDFHLYVIDAGALAPLVALPHTGAVVRHDDVDRIARLVRLVGAEIDSRNSTSDGGRRRPVTSNRGSMIPHLVVMIDDVGALRNHLYDRSRREREGDDSCGPDEVWAGIARIVHDGPAVGICTLATAKRERDVPATFAAQMPSRLVMRLADPTGYASFGFRPVDIPRFVPGRALDPADGAELQIVQPPASLAGAVATLAAEPARSRPPTEVEERST